MKSILQSEKEPLCYICKYLHDDFSEKSPLHMHHIIYGWGKRRLSEKYGLKVRLCLRHHEGDIHGNSEAVHGRGRTEDVWLKRRAQMAWEQRYTEEPGTEEAHRDFRAIFGKNYL